MPVFQVESSREEVLVHSRVKLKASSLKPATEQSTRSTRIWGKPAQAGNSTERSWFCAGRGKRKKTRYAKLHVKMTMTNVVGFSWIVVQESKLDIAAISTRHARNIRARSSLSVSMNAWRGTFSNARIESGKKRSRKSVVRTEVMEKSSSPTALLNKKRYFWTRSRWPGRS